MRIRFVRSAALLWSAAILVSGCPGTEPPVATTIVVTPGSVNFATVNATQALTAKVIDQKGDSMTGQTIAWSVDNAAIATVTTNGIATAKGNGTATITATTGTVSQPVTVTVSQVATSFLKSTGDAQIGTVGVALATPLTVHLADAGGTAIPGATVAFTVALGGGSLVGAATTTNASGDATSGWTLGTVAGSAQAVNVTSGALSASFTATAVAGAVSAVTAQAGNNQTRVIGLPLVTAPSVKVTDTFGNAKVGQTVLFAVVSGGGSLTGATQTTNAQGIATVGSWSMGPSAGANTLSATAQGTGVSFTFTATAATAGAPTTMTVLAATASQTALQGSPTNFRPAVTITDAGGQPVAGVSVTFAVASGGGSLANATVSTNAFGIAQSGAWTVGAAAGANSVTATAVPGGITGNPATIAATGAAPTYNIVIQNVGPAFSPGVQAAFDSAVAKWQRVVYQDVPDVNPNLAANACSFAHPAVSTVVDDLLILAKIDSIDGPSGTLGFAGPCISRGTGSFTIVAIMVFDSADVANFVASGRFEGVILHEMGHSLGVGTHWTNYGCTQNPSSAGNAQDTHFNCARALAAMDSLGGAAYTGGNRVPVENCGTSAFTPAQGCGSGSYNGHWREFVFDAELMTPLAEASGVATPMSLLTIASLWDIGYVVNYAVAQAYNPVFTTPPALRAAGAASGFFDDIYRGPEYFVDPSGRIVRVTPGASMNRPSRTALTLATLTVVVSCRHHRSEAAALGSSCSPLSSALDSGADVSILRGSFETIFTATAGPRSGQSVQGRLTLRAQAPILVALPARADQMVVTQPVIGQLDLNVEDVGGVRMGDPMSADSTTPGVALYVTRGPGGTPGNTVGRVGSGSNARGIERYDGGYFTLYPRMVTSTELRGDWRSGGAGGEPPVEARGHFCAVRTGN